MSFRIDKINKEIKRRVMEIIQREVDDPAVGMVSITRVDTTADLRESRIYFSSLNEGDIKRLETIFNKMRKFIRALLGKKLRLRILPELFFCPDTGIKYSVDIYRKIEEVVSAEEDNRTDKEQ